MGDGWHPLDTANRGSQSVQVVLEVLDGDARNGGTDEPDLMTLPPAPMATSIRGRYGP